MRLRLLAAGLVVSAAFAAGVATPAFGQGHPGGCAAFGQANQTYAPDLGHLVSSFALLPDGRGVGDVVQEIDLVNGCVS